MADADNTKVNLQNDITIVNASGAHTFKAGHNVEIPKAMADDVARMDYDHNQYKKGLLEKRTYEVNSGTIGVGGGE